MQLEVGMVLEGKVTGITKFGAFIELPGGKTGMVHISEVAPTFVKEIRDFVTENQTVKVKVLSISEDGKVSLSMKKAMDPVEVLFGDTHTISLDLTTRSSGGGSGGGSGSRGGSLEWQGSRGRSSEPASFEDMMSRFKQASDEKMSDLKRVTENKRGGFSRRGSGQQK